MIRNAAKILLEESHLTGYSSTSRCMRIVEGILILLVAFIFPGYSLLPGGTVWNLLSGIYLIVSPEASKVMCVIFLALMFTSSDRHFLFGFMTLTNGPKRLHDFVPYCTENLQNPYPWYKALRDESPIYKIPGFDYYVVSRYQDIQTICKNTKAFSSNLVSILLRGGSTLNRPISGIVDVLALQDPPIHSRQRRIAMKSLSPKFFRSLEDEVRVLTRCLFDKIFTNERSSCLCWMNDFANVLPMRVTLRLLGLPEEDHEMVKRYADCGVALLAGVNTAEEFVQNITEASKLLSWVQQRVNEKIRNFEKQVEDSENLIQKNDFTIHLIREGLKKGELSRNEVSSIVLQIIMAGNDSSASAMGSCVRMLVERPDIQKMLREDQSKIPDFVDEILRLESPFAGHFRKVVKPVKIRDSQFLPGDRIQVLWASGNRDPRVFDRPDELNLSRKSKRRHLGFGYGIHMCLGNPLAKMEIRVVLEELLSKTKTIYSRYDIESPMYIQSAFVRSLDSLYVGVETI